MSTVENEYTQEEYIAGIRKAKEQGNMAMAEAIAKEAALVYPNYRYEPPPGPTITEKVKTGLMDYGKTVSRNVSEFDPSEALSEFPEKVTKRTERILGEDKFDSPLGIKKGLVAGSQVIRTGTELAFDSLGIIIPDSVKKGAETVWNTIKDTDIAKKAAEALEVGYEAYSEFAEENPEFAETFESTIDVMAVLTPGSKSQINTFTKPAERAKEKYNVLVKTEKRKKLKELLGPQKVGERGYEGEYESLGGILDKTEYVPTPSEQKMLDILTDTPSINANDTFVKMYNKIQEEVRIEDNKLKIGIKQQGNPKFSGENFKILLGSKLKKEFEKGAEYNGLSTESQKIANRYLKKAIELINDNKADALGLLKARREFDRFVNQGSKGGILDPTSENAKSVAGRYVRNILNDKLKSIAGKETIETSLDRMHQLLNARDIVSKRRIGEGGNRLSRVWDKISDVSNLPSTPLALFATLRVPIAGLVGLGTAGTTGAVAAGTSAFILLKAADKKVQVKYYGKLLSGIDKAIKAYKGDKNLVRELKADRAYFVYLLDQARQEKQEEAVVAP